MFYKVPSYAWTEWSAPEIFPPEKNSIPARTAFLMGSLVGGFGLVFVLGSPIGLTRGIAFGLATVLVGGISVSNGAEARHTVGVALAAMRGRLPWRFAAFCRRACAAGLLRVAGAGYRFRHRELQEWLIDD
ncbi:hypothetical protein [Streptosporangium sp. NPDC000509]|uniref:hypothetical protein n=1 Tax=Streptosporangium sp. NPDC000509 TaxID=3366186 RepID=UPI003685DEDE